MFHGAIRGGLHYHVGIVTSKTDICPMTTSYEVHLDSHCELFPLIDV